MYTCTPDSTSFLDCLDTVTAFISWDKIPCLLAKGLVLTEMHLEQWVTPLSICIRVTLIECDVIWLFMNRGLTLSKYCIMLPFIHLTHRFYILSISLHSHTHTHTHTQHLHAQNGWNVLHHTCASDKNSYAILSWLLEEFTHCDLLKTRDFLNHVKQVWIHKSFANSFHLTSNIFPASLSSALRCLNSSTLAKQLSSRKAY